MSDFFDRYDDRDEREPEPIDTELPSPRTWSERAVAALANGRTDYEVEYFDRATSGGRGERVRITLIDVAHDDDGLIVISRVAQPQLFVTAKPVTIGTAAIYKAADILDADGRYPRAWDAWATAVGAHRLRQVLERWRVLLAAKQPAPGPVEPVSHPF